MAEERIIVSENIKILRECLKLIPEKIAIVERSIEGYKQGKIPKELLAHTIETELLWGLANAVFHYENLNAIERKGLASEEIKYVENLKILKERIKSFIDSNVRSITNTMGDKDSIALLTAATALVAGKNLLGDFTPPTLVAGMTVDGKPILTRDELIKAGDAFVNAHKNQIAKLSAAPAIAVAQKIEFLLAERISQFNRQMTEIAKNCEEDRIKKIIAIEKEIKERWEEKEKKERLKIELAKSEEELRIIRMLSNHPLLVFLIYV